MTIDSPPTKRIKLEEDNDTTLFDHVSDSLHQGAKAEDDSDIEGEHCSICLQPMSDRTVIPACSHEFCFECLLVWTEQSRRCPLCSGDIGGYLIHNIRSKYDYQKHHLAPLRSSPSEVIRIRAEGNTRRRARREIVWGRRQRELDAADALQRAIEKRRWVYRHRLYAKHVASNSYTRYRPFPTPTQFAANSDLITRATIFIRRELMVWDSLDVEFLTTFTVSLMKSLDIRSEPAVKLLAEFLDMDADMECPNPRANAEHFAHELYSYLRSPFRDLSVYDSVVQYDTPADVPPPRRLERTRKWNGQETRGRSESPEPGPSRPRGQDYSPRRSARPRSRSRSHERQRSSRHVVQRADSRRGDVISPSRSPSSDRNDRSHYGNSPRFSARDSPPISQEQPLRGPRHPHNGEDVHVTDPVPHQRRDYERGQKTSKRPISRNRDINIKGGALTAQDMGYDEASFPPHDINPLPTDPSNVSRIDVKGKGRAVDYCPSSPSPSAGSAEASPLDPLEESQNLSNATAHHDNIVHNRGSSQDDPSSQDAQAISHLRHTNRQRPRIRQSAWQTMQAHLVSSRADRGPNTAPQHPLAEPELAIRGASSNLSSTSAAVPSTDDALSPSQTPQSEASSSTPPTPPELATTVPATPAIPETPNNRVGAGRFSSREIMARTRAKLARLKQEAGAAAITAESTTHAVNSNPTSQGSAPQSNITEKVARDAVADANSSTSTSATTGDTVTTHPIGISPLSADQSANGRPSAATLRARLLDKLQREKRAQTQQMAMTMEMQATSPPATGVNGDIQTHTTRGGGGRRPSPPAAIMTADRTSSVRASGGDSCNHRAAVDMMESKLRAQAQLRVKLAAARRVAERTQAVAIGDPVLDARSREPTGDAN